MRAFTPGLLLLVATLSSCSFVKDQLTKPSSEKPPQKEQQYLSKGSVANELDLGPDQKFLLDEFTQVKQQKIALETQVSELRATNEGLRASLKQAEEERDKMRRIGAGTEAEGERLKKTLHEREAKILSLSMEKARLQKEMLALKIATLEKQIEDARSTRATEAAAEPIK